MNRRDFESFLMRNGTSEVAAANACGQFDNADGDEAKQAHVAATLKKLNLNVKAKSDNKSTARADTKADTEPAHNADGTFRADDKSTPNVDESKRKKRRKKF